MTECIRSSGRRRAPGEGSIYETSDGRLRGAIAWTDASGKRQRRVVSGRTRADIKRALNAVRLELGQGRAPTPAGTVAEFLDTWLVASRQRVRASTWRGYEQSVRSYIKPAVGRQQLGKLLPTDVETMTAGMVDRGLSPRTAALARVVLRRALQDAVRDGRVTRNVAALARPPRQTGRALEAGRDYLTGPQLRTLLASVRLHPFGPLITVSVATGIRQGEALALCWSDIDLDGRTLRVRRSLARAWDRSTGVPVQSFALSETKTARSQRTINLPAAAVTAFELQRERQEAQRAAAGSAWQDLEGLVFTNAVGMPLAGHDVTHAFHRLLEVAGLPSIPYHGLRHSFATASLASGIALQVVSASLGHSSIVLTSDRYGGVVPRQLRDVADAMDRTLASDS